MTSLDQENRWNRAQMGILASVILPTRVLNSICSHDKNKHCWIIFQFSSKAFFVTRTKFQYPNYLTQPEIKSCPFSSTFTTAKEKMFFSFVSGIPITIVRSSSIFHQILTDSSLLRVVLNYPIVSWGWISFLKIVLNFLPKGETLERTCRVREILSPFQRRENVIQARTKSQPSMY